MSKRKKLVLLALAFVSLLGLTPRAEASWYACECSFCLMYPNSDCVDYSTWNSQNCALFVFDPANQCLSRQSQTSSSADNSLLTEIFQPAS